MALNNIEYLLLSLCTSVILFIIASSLYLTKSQYNKTNALIQKSNCHFSDKSNEYICDLTISYLIDNDIIINELIIKSIKPYNIGDIIKIDYDVNNYFNMSYETFYKKYALLSFFSAMILLLLAFFLMKEIKENLFNKIVGLFDFFT